MRPCFILFLMLFAKAALPQADALQADSGKAKKQTCYLVKTDMLPLMNTLVEKGHTAFSLCAGISFNMQYGLQLRLNYYNLAERTGMSADMQYVYFFRVYENAMLNGGAYCSILNQQNNGDYLKYEDWLMQAGICGGCSVRFTRHWFISPTVLIGLQKHLNRNIEEGRSNYLPEGLSSKLRLEVGYRF